MIYVDTKDGKDYGFYLEKDGLQNVVELTDNEHMALMDGQAEGKVIVFHEGEKPTLEEPPPPSDDDLAKEARQKRDMLINAIQWRIERYSQQKTLGIKTDDSDDWYKAALAVDSSADVSKAFEFKNFGVFGALLIQVIPGDHFKGISQVGNLSVVTSYIDSVAPPVMYTVRTPELKPIGMTVTLLASESTSENQGIIRNRINGYLNATARPGVQYTEGSFRDAIVDGVKISFAQV